MPDLTISIITVVYNAQNTLPRCIESVFSQHYKKIEYIIIDGGSTDDTNEIVQNYSGKIAHYQSEPDLGIYDAMNKGLAKASGEIVGMLNADDYFADELVLDEVANAFADTDIDVVYGDLDFVNEQGRIVRRWRSSDYAEGKFNYGWMPPHPTFYCRADSFKQLGNYRLDYGSAGDYELMVRFIHLNKLTVKHVNKVMVKMLTGGVSNNSIKGRVKALVNDFNAMKNNGVRLPFIAVILKPMRKILQFF